MFTIQIEDRIRTYQTLEDAVYRKMERMVQGVSVGPIFDRDGHLVPRSEWWPVYQATEHYQARHGKAA